MTSSCFRTRLEANCNCFSDGGSANGDGSAQMSFTKQTTTFHNFHIFTFTF